MVAQYIKEAVRLVENSRRGMAIKNREMLVGKERVVGRPSTEAPQLVKAVPVELRIEAELGATGEGGVESKFPSCNLILFVFY